MRGPLTPPLPLLLATAATKRDARAIHAVLVAIERNSGIRGTPSARGEGEGPLLPQCQHCPSRHKEDIDTASATSPRQQTYAITAPLWERQGGGGALQHG